MIDLLAISAIDRDTEISYVRTRARLAGARPGRRAGCSIPAGCCRCCRRASPATAIGNGHATTATATAATATPAAATPDATMMPARRSLDVAPAADHPVPRLDLGRPALPDPGRRSCSARRCSSSSAATSSAPASGDDPLLRGAGRHLRPARRADRRRRAGAHLHRRHQRPDPLRDHAHPDEGGPGRSSSSTTRRGRRRWPPSCSAVLLAIVVGVNTRLAARRGRVDCAPAREPSRCCSSATPLLRALLQVVGVLLPGGGDRWRLPGQARGRPTRQRRPALRRSSRSPPRRRSTPRRTA